MIVRKMTAWIVSTALLLGCGITSVYAESEEREVQSDDPIYVFADTDYNDHYSGEGNSNTDITHETTIEGDDPVSGGNSNGTTTETSPSEGTPPSTEPSPPEPTISQEELEDQATMDQTADIIDEVTQSATSQDIKYIRDDNTFILSQDIDMSIPPLEDILGLYDSLNNPELDFDLPNYNTGLTVGGSPLGSLSDKTLYQNLLNYQMEKFLEGYFDLIFADSLVETDSNPSQWDTIMGGSYFEKQLADTALCFPTNGQALYQALLPYLSQMITNGTSTIPVKKVEVYSIATFGIRTIKTSSPLPSFHWIVNGDGQSVDTYTSQNYLRMLFQKSGTYSVKVMQTNNVIRNNKVGGTKTELWVLDTGDIYSGIVIYHHSTSFEAFIGNDIGPTEEEVELVADGFTANVTDSMLNSVQFIDANGNIHVASSDFTTEKIE